MNRLRSRKVFIPLAIVVVLIATLVIVGVATSTPGYRTVSKMITGTPEPDGSAVQLDTTLYLPDTTPAPAVLLAQGFGGDKNDLAGTAQTLAEHGYVALAYTARGFGDSGGLIHFDSPSYEVHDAKLLVDYLTSLPQVDKSKIGVAGSSYGGGARIAARRLRPAHQGGGRRHHLEQPATCAVPQCRGQQRRCVQEAVGGHAVRQRLLVPARRPAGLRGSRPDPERAQGHRVVRPVRAERVRRLSERRADRHPERRDAHADGAGQPGEHPRSHQSADPAHPGRAGLLVLARRGRRQRARHRRPRHPGQGCLAPRWPRRLVARRRRRHLADAQLVRQGVRVRCERHAAVRLLRTGGLAVVGRRPPASADPPSAGLSRHQRHPATAEVAHAVGAAATDRRTGRRHARGDHRGARVERHPEHLRRARPGHGVAERGACSDSCLQLARAVVVAAHRRLVHRAVDGHHEVDVGRDAVRRPARRLDRRHEHTALTARRAVAPHQPDPWSSDDGDRAVAVDRAHGAVRTPRGAHGGDYRLRLPAAAGRTHVRDLARRIVSKPDGAHIQRDGADHR